MRTKFGASEGIQENKGKKGKMRKPYPKFSPCNGCAALELQGGFPPWVWGAEERSENSFFSLKKSLGGQTVSPWKGEIPSAGLSADRRGGLFVLSSHLELAFIPRCSFSFSFFFLGGKHCFFPRDIK